MAPVHAVWTHNLCRDSMHNLTGVAVQFATQDRQNATQVQKCIAVLTIKYPITIYISD